MPSDHSHSLKPWRVAAALVAPPLVTLAVFFGGLAVNRVETVAPPLRFLVVILVCGPLAPAAGVAAVDALANVTSGETRRGRGAYFTLVFAGLVSSGLVWRRLFFTYCPQSWGG